MEEEISLDVALDIIGTLRVMKMKELTAETDLQKKAEIEREFDMLTIEERIVQGLRQFEGWEEVQVSILDKINDLYAPRLKAYYAA